MRIRNSEEVTVGEWMLLEVARNEKATSLSVNGLKVFGEDPRRLSDVIGKQVEKRTMGGGTEELSLNGGLFLGGVWPGFVVAADLGVSDPFQGCIGNPLRLNGVETDVLAAATESGNLGACEAPDACAAAPCPASATCRNAPAGGHTCLCPVEGAADCAPPACLDHSCGEHGICRPAGPSPVCDCHIGWAGPTCEECECISSHSLRVREARDAP